MKGSEAKTIEVSLSSGRIATRYSGCGAVVALQDMEEHPLLENGVEVMKVLLEHGGDIDQTDEAGQTALHTGKILLHWQACTHRRSCCRHDYSCPFMTDTLTCGSMFSRRVAAGYY